ncbi:MAG TPA: hypothetical protein ENJ31_12205, partial [Anaerolineae bacterium]|nr:hypothetical protein [Anaerolineae bacterium]
MSDRKKRGGAAGWLRPWWIVTLAAIAYLLAVTAAHGGDPLALATLGTRFSEGDPNGSEGYDGQFAYYIALDPLGGWQRCDVPAYRYQRILYPLLARLLALGQARLLPYTLPLVGLLALAAGTWLTERLLLRYRVSRWYALTYGLYAGQLMAVRLDLNEPLSQALVQGGVLSAERDRWPLSVALFALAALAKETALVFVAGYLLYLLARRRWRRLLAMALGVGLPFLAWQAALWAWLGRPGLGSGGAGATGWEILPFRGLWSVGAISLPVLGLLALVMVPLAVIPSLLSLWAAGRDLWKGRWHPLTAVLLTNALVLLFLPQSTYREPLAMLRLTIGLMAATILFGARKRSRRILNYTLLW